MPGVIPAMKSDVVEVEIVVAHSERATLRVGDVFLKIDADQTRTDVEVEAMAMAPIPTPEVLWRRPPVLALAAVPGTALGRLGEPSIASSAAWAAAGAAARMLHDAPLPPWPGQSLDESHRTSTANASGSSPTASCPPTWSRATAGLPRPRSGRGHRCSRTATCRSTHVFVDGDEITGVLDWSEAGQGDALYDLATLTLGHEEHLGDVVSGYGTDVDLDVIRAWWSLRSLLGDPLAGRARLRPVLARLRGRRAEIPDVRLCEAVGYDRRSAALEWAVSRSAVFRTDEVT